MHKRGKKEKEWKHAVGCLSFLLKINNIIVGSALFFFVICCCCCCFPFLFPYLPYNNSYLIECFSSVCESSDTICFVQWVFVYVCVICFFSSAINLLHISSSFRLRHWSTCFILYFSSYIGSYIYKLSLNFCILREFVVLHSNFIHSNPFSFNTYKFIYFIGKWTLELNIIYLFVYLFVSATVAHFIAINLSNKVSRVHEMYIVAWDVQSLTSFSIVLQAIFEAVKLKLDENKCSNCNPIDLVGFFGAKNSPKTFGLVWTVVIVCLSLNLSPTHSELRDKPIVFL